MDNKLIRGALFGAVAVIMLLAKEISFTTPPFGLLLFVMQGVAPPGTRFSEICLATEKAHPYRLEILRNYFPSSLQYLLNSKLPLRKN